MKKPCMYALNRFVPIRWESPDKHIIEMGHMTTIGRPHDIMGTV